MKPQIINAKMNRLIFRGRLVKAAIFAATIFMVAVMTGSIYLRDRVYITDNGVIARDLGSTNGTYVEGHQVPAATLLDGNTITIGRTRILYWASAQAQE